MFDILIYCCALLIGLILGLTGGGGSILTVPVLVYIVGLTPVVGTAYSLFIVGMTAAFGSIQNYRNGVVVVRTALKFALPSLMGIFLTRKFIVPALPDVLFQNDFFPIRRDLFLMILFAMVMLMAASAMLRKKPVADNDEAQSPVKLFIKIFFIGIIMGLIGAGGGFLIIPVLYYVAKLPMRKAIGTSLLIISLNSLVGFAGAIGTIAIDWDFIMSFSAFSIIGVFIGIYSSRFFKESTLKKIFAFFVIIIALIILTRELFTVFSNEGII